MATPRPVSQAPPSDPLPSSARRPTTFRQAPETVPPPPDAPRAFVASTPGCFKVVAELHEANAVACAAVAAAVAAASAAEPVPEPVVPAPTPPPTRREPGRFSHHGAWVRASAVTGLRVQAPQGNGDGKWDAHLRSAMPRVLTQLNAGTLKLEVPRSAKTASTCVTDVSAALPQHSASRESSSPFYAESNSDRDTFDAKLAPSALGMVEDTSFASLFAATTAEPSERSLNADASFASLFSLPSSGDGVGGPLQWREPNSTVGGDNAAAAEARSPSSLSNPAAASFAPHGPGSARHSSIGGSAAHWAYHDFHRHQQRHYEDHFPYRPQTSDLGALSAMYATPWTPRTPGRPGRRSARGTAPGSVARVLPGASSTLVPGEAVSREGEVAASSRLASAPAAFPQPHQGGTCSSATASRSVGKGSPSRRRMSAANWASDARASVAGHKGRWAATPRNKLCPISRKHIEDAIVLRCGHRISLDHLAAAAPGFDGPGGGQEVTGCGQGGAGHLICPLCGDSHCYVLPSLGTARSVVSTVYSDTKRTIAGKMLIGGIWEHDLMVPANM